MPVRTAEHRRYSSGLLRYILFYQNIVHSMTNASRLYKICAANSARCGAVKNSASLAMFAVFVNQPSIDLQRANVEFSDARHLRASVETAS